MKLEPIIIDPKTFLYEHCSLPALPRILFEVQELMQSTEVNIENVADCIAKDSGLVAEVLKVVNSAYYSLPHHVSNIKFAIAYIGLREMYHIVLSVSVLNTLAPDDLDEFNQIWFHSYFAALSAKLLVKKFERYLPYEEIWIAALLKNIGNLVYLKFFPDHYKVIQKYSIENGCLFPDAEKHFDLPSSIWMGQLLCDRWELPDMVKSVVSINCIEALTRPKEKLNAYNRIIHLSHLITNLAMDQMNSENKEIISNIIVNNLNLSKEEFLLLMGDIYHLKAEAESILQ